jgi:hypothetical protein
MFFQAKGLLGILLLAIGLSYLIFFRICGLLYGIAAGASSAGKEGCKWPGLAKSV